MLGGAPCLLLGRGPQVRAGPCVCSRVRIGFSGLEGSPWGWGGSGGRHTGRGGTVMSASFAPGAMPGGRNIAV